MPAVGPDNEVGADRQLTIRRLGAEPDDTAALLEQIGRFRRWKDW